MKHLSIFLSLLLLSACSMPQLALAQQEAAPDGPPPRAMQLLCLCASLSPALAGLPHLVEYAWNDMLTVWRPTSK